MQHGQRWRFRERYFLAHTDRTELSLRGLSALEQSVYRAHRWWPLAELEATVETVFPEGLGAVVRRALGVSETAEGY